MKRIIAILFFLLLSMKLWAQNTSSIANEIEFITSLKDWNRAKMKINDFYKSLPESLNELQIVAKYEVSKIEKNVDIALAEEENLYNGIKNSGDIKLCKSYLEKYPFGKNKEEVSWKAATLSNSWEGYYNYVHQNSFSNYKNEAKARMETLDEAAFEYAKRSGRSIVIKQYIDTYFEGKYLSEAKILLRERLEDELFESAKKVNTINSYELYIEKTQTGNYIKDAQDALEFLYFNQAEVNFKKKRWLEAVSEYDNYLSKFPNGSNFSMAKKHWEIAKLKSKFESKTISYFSFDYEKGNEIGLSFGRLNTQSSNLYMKTKFNKEIFSRGGLLNTIDNNGNSSSLNNVSFLGDTQYNNWSFILGLNVKISNPIWLYIGGGVLNKGNYWKTEEYNSDTGKTKIRWMKNTDQQSYKFVGESGLALNVVNKAIIKLGIGYYDKIITPQIGLGIAW